MGHFIEIFIKDEYGGHINVYLRCNDVNELTHPLKISLFMYLFFITRHLFSITNNNKVNHSSAIILLCLGSLFLSAWLNCYSVANHKIRVPQNKKLRNFYENEQLKRDKKNGQ